MKKTIYKLLSVVIIAVSLMSCKQEKKTDKFDGYTIDGSVKGIDNVFIKLVETGSIDEVNKNVIDSTKIINGAFSFKGKAASVDMVNLVIDSKYQGRFMLENSPIDIEIDVTQLEGRNTSFIPKVSGSKSHDLFAAIEDKGKTIMEEEKYKPLEEIRELFAKAQKSDNKDDLIKAQDKQKELAALSQDRMDRYKKNKIDFVRNNPNSPVAVYILGFQYSEGRMTKTELKEFYNLFKGDAKNTDFYKNHITKVYKDNFENLGIGNMVPDFTLNTVDGKPFTLSHVESKYTLVDFWASWCVPCRKSFPHLKELRTKYQTKGFKIVGIGTADEEDKWRKAIKEDQTPWIHVFDTNEKRAYGQVAKKYGVPHLPTTFLIDKNQTIVLRNPTKEELDTKLKDIFGF
ncbi:TlpA disulfide reductase family protein [uncultured Algibacter sp.]|uniref:TlpA disulfide reductase family protein n=1 Tax=uncultured Algibacter sp. TaxID=298659 RepID=UPI003216A185